MKPKQAVLQKLQKTRLGTRLLEDKRYRVVTKAVFSLVLNLAYAFYNGILGALSSSLIFVASAAYYLLLCGMRFSVVLLDKKSRAQSAPPLSAVVGVMLIILSVVFHSIVFFSMKDSTATVYGTIPMITIATFTFAKITMAIITAVRHKGESFGLFKAVNAIRYSEVAVSLLTMQQSMLVSFEGSDGQSAVILNACTGAAVCFFILALGIHMLKISRKGTEL